MLTQFLDLPLQIAALLRTASLSRLEQFVGFGSQSLGFLTKTLLCQGDCLLLQCFGPFSKLVGV
jgi:hypothetical protein